MGIGVNPELEATPMWNFKANEGQKLELMPHKRLRLWAILHVTGAGLLCS